MHDLGQFGLCWMVWVGWFGFVGSVTLDGLVFYVYVYGRVGTVLSIYIHGCIDRRYTSSL